MPTFEKEINVDEYINVDVYVDVEDFYAEMDDAEKKEMLDLLTENGFTAGSSKSHTNWEFIDAINKLSNNYYSLSNEEIDAVIKLAKRF